jgi:Cdc6-like AAA superfamily ATPase
MLSFKKGIPIAYVKNYKKDAVRIDVNPKKSKTKTKAPRYHHLDGNETFIPLLNNEERDVAYICGASGSGKSTFAAGLIKEWKKDYPKGDVYAFSRTKIKDDPAFRKIKGIIQIDVDRSIVEHPIDITTEIEENSLILFDDVGTIHDKDVRIEVEKLMADIMEVGRKLRIWIIITSHLIIPNEKKFARTVLNEAQKLVVFPKSGGIQQIRYTLKTYLGYDTKQIAQFLDTDSRWLLFSKTYPQYVLSDDEIILP